MTLPLTPKAADVSSLTMRLLPGIKESLDITWFKDKSLTDLDNLPDPDELAVETMENLEERLESFKAIIASLNAKK